MAANPRLVAKAITQGFTPSNQPAGGNGGFGGFPASMPGNGVSPMVADFSAWTSGQARRDPAWQWRMFSSGSFGPLQPITPVAIDAPDPGTDDVSPRRFQYPVGWNMPMGPPGTEGLKLCTFQQLRTVAQTYSIARACIDLRKQELVGLEWDIVPTKAAEKKMRANHGDRREWDERRAKVMKFFRRPDPDCYFSFATWFSAQLEDILAIDAWTLSLQPSLRKGKGVMGSNLAALPVIDGSTIRPLLTIKGGRPRPPAPAWQQYEFGVPRADLMTVMSGGDVADMQDALAGEYTSNQLLYLPYDPMDWTPYGMAPAEKAIVPIMSGLNRQQYQLDYYAQGTVPGLFVSAGDPTMTPSQIRELQDALNAMAGDPAWKHRIIVLPGGSRTDPMRPAELAGPFDELIMTQTCMAYGVMPMELGVTPRSSTSGHSGGAVNQMGKMSSDAQKRKANKPLLHRCMEVFDFIIQILLKQDDMRFLFEGLEETEDESTAVAILVNEISHGLKSIDEARIARGEQPWGVPITSDPVLLLPTGLIPIKSLDPETGQLPTPPMPPMPGQPGEAGNPGEAPLGGQPGAPGRPGGAGVQPALPAGKKPGSSAPTPAHSGAHAADAVNGQPATAKVNTISALAELDLIRRRLVKGRSIDGWRPEHIPGDVFATLSDLASVESARTLVKALDHRQRRAEAIADAESSVEDGLRRLAAGLTHGTVSTATFVDQAVDVMRHGIRSGLAAGARHARADGTVTKSVPIPPRSLPVPRGTEGRYGLYAGAVNRAYEHGYGLAVLGSSENPDSVVISWHAREGACELCSARDGKLFTVATLPGLPGDGGPGKSATICRGGSRCRCRLAYRTVGVGEARPSEEVDDAYLTPTRQLFAAQVADACEALHGPDPETAFDLLLDDIASVQAEAQRPYLVRFVRDILAAHTGGQKPKKVGVRYTKPDNDGGGWLVPAAVIAAALAVAIASQQAQQQQAAPATVGAPIQQPPTLREARGTQPRPTGPGVARR